MVIDRLESHKELLEKGFSLEETDKVFIYKNPQYITDEDIKIIVYKDTGKMFIGREWNLFLEFDYDLARILIEISEELKLFREKKE